MLTAYTITDEQIHALRSDVILCIWPIQYQGGHFIDASDGRGGYYNPDDIVNWCIDALGVDCDGTAINVATDVRQTARTRCAEILRDRE